MFFQKTKSTSKIDSAKLLKEISNSKKIKRYTMFLIGTLLSAIAFNLFLKPNHIINGVSGLSIITEKLFNIDPSLVILIANVILLVASYVFLGKDKTSKTVVGAFLYPILVKLTDGLTDYVDLGSTEPVVLALFGAIISGIGTGMIFKNNFTTGGSDVIKQILSYYMKIPFSKANTYSELLVVLAGIFVFGWDSALYSIITIFIIGYVSDRVILGVSEYKTLQIITNKQEAIIDFITNSLNHGVTIVDAKGGYTSENKKVLLCAMPTREYFLASEAIRKLDPHAFVIVIDTYEVQDEMQVEK